MPEQRDLTYFTRLKILIDASEKGRRLR